MNRIFAISRRMLAVFLVFIGSPNGVANDSRSPIQPPPSKDVPKSLSEIDETKPITVNGYRVTFGVSVATRVRLSQVRNPWVTPEEVEGNNPKWTWHSGDSGIARSQIKTPETIPSELGDGKFTSRPVETLGEAKSLMKEMIARVGTDLSAIHLHLRFPKSSVSAIPLEQWNGWFSRVADTAVAWRLKQLPDPWYGLNSPLHTRLYPDSPSDRGAIRIRTQDSTAPFEPNLNLGDSMDIELRGFQNDFESASQLAKIILTGTQNPKLILGFPNSQKELLRPPLPLADAVNLAAIRDGEPLSQRAIRFLNALEDEAMGYQPVVGQPTFRQKRTYDGTTQFPILGFETAPFLSRKARRRLTKATETFLHDLKGLAEKESAPAMKKRSVKDWQGLASRYRNRIKQWEKESRFFESLNESLLSPPLPTGDRLTGRAVLDPTTLRFALQHGSKDSKKAAARWLRDHETDPSIQILSESLHQSEKSTGRAIARALGDSDSVAHRALMTEAVHHNSKTVRRIARKFQPLVTQAEYGVENWLRGLDLRRPFLIQGSRVQFAAEVEGEAKRFVSERFSKLKTWLERFEGNRSVKVTLRFPTEALQKIPSKDWANWLNRVSDAEFLRRIVSSKRPWRLLASSDDTQTFSSRPIEESLFTVRFPELRGRKEKTFRGPIEVELRTPRSEVSQLDKPVRLIVAGFLHPESIRSHPSLLETHEALPHSLTEKIARFRRSQTGEPLNDQEASFLASLQREAGRYGAVAHQGPLKESPESRKQLPLLGLENARYLTHEERDVIKRADQKFAQRVERLMGEMGAELPSTSNRNDWANLIKRYGTLIQKWTKEAAIETALSNSLIETQKRTERLALEQLALDCARR